MPRTVNTNQPFYIKQREQNVQMFLDRIHSLSDNVTGIYKLVCLENIKLFAFEVAQQACYGPAEKLIVEKAVGKDIVKLALRVFPDVKPGDKLETYVYQHKSIVIPKTTSKKATRIKVYSIETIFNFIKNNPEEMYYVDEEGNRSKLRRAKVFFEKGIKCIDCPVEASFFALELWEDKSFHLDLFGIDSDGDEVLMTVDHIHPKSKGGKDTMENYQPLCTVCNYLKSDAF